MHKRIKGFLLTILVVATFKAKGQDEYVIELNRVMSFAAADFVSFKMVSKASTSAVVEPRDTVAQFSEYIKEANDIYFKNNEQESFLQDSFYVQINHEKKYVWFSKVDDSTKKKISLLPLESKQVRNYFSEKFSISKEILKNGMAQLVVKPQDSIAEDKNGFEFRLRYRQANFLPDEMEIILKTKQLISESEIASLKSYGLSTQDIIVERDGANYLERSQSVMYQFRDIQFSNSKGTSMPSWKNFIKSSDDFSEVNGLGALSDYEIVKTF